MLKRTITHYDQFILVFLRSLFIVGPDWANFESSWCQNFLQNLKTTLLKYKLLCVFWVTFGKNWANLDSNIWSHARLLDRERAFLGVIFRRCSKNPIAPFRYK